MFSKRTARYLPTGWETGNTHWKRFIRRNGRFILNIESQSECYYYEFYCCTPITVLAVYLSRWRQNVTITIKLSTISRYSSFHMWLWLGIELKNSTTKYDITPKKFHPTTQWLNRPCDFSSVGIYFTKPCAIGKDLTVFIKEIGVSRYIGNPARFNILQPSYLSSA